jgi:uncharacterized membrane protein
MKKNFLQDKDLENLIGNLLRTGVLASSATIIAGGCIYLWQHGAQLPAYQSFAGLTMSFYSLPLVLKGVVRGSGEHIIQLGVLFLIATPVARVVFSIFGFIKEKDRLYIVITLLVLIIIGGSMLLGLKG